MRFSLARIMTHPQSHHGQPPTKIQVGQKTREAAGWKSPYSKTDFDEKVYIFRCMVGNILYNFETRKSDI
jgi:hypothetical protein